MIHQSYQLKRALEKSGKDCRFYRTVENEFHEATGEQNVYTCRGLFHEANGYLNVSITEAGKLHTKKEPKLLILFTKDIRKGDFVDMDSSRFEVTGVDDLGCMHLCLDLSLEVVE